jgi:hypothetical protein
MPKNKKPNLESNPKSYDDLVKYAKSFTFQNQGSGALPSFPSNLAITPYETIGPYYGSESSQEYAAAKQYAELLKSQQDALVTVPESYYEALNKPVSVNQFQGPTHYDVNRNSIRISDPIDWAERKLDLNASELAKNNYGSQKQLAQGLLKNLPKSYLDAIEHEAVHAADSLVGFSPKPSVKLSDFGYMAQEDHLVTGLGKVQRERYSMSGKRFESPDEFKQFIFGLAKHENPEEAISGFSEEAKRTLRYQIENARSVQKYYDDIERWRNNKSLLKGQEPSIRGNPDLLEKSAQLIPALVSNFKYKHPTS